VLQQEDASIYDDTVELGDPHASNTIPARVDRLGTLVPRTVGDGGTINFTPVLHNVSRAGSRFTKTAGNDGSNDALVYSRGVYVAFALSWRADQTDQTVTVGLDANPGSGHGQGVIDFAFRTQSDGTLDILENSTTAVVSNIDGGYSTGDLLSITYD